MWIFRLVPFALLAALAACADAPAGRETGSGPLVVATLHPLASVVEAVAGDAARVRTLLPPGAHPDSYEMRPRDAEALSGAELVVSVGGAADAWLGDTGDTPRVVFTEGMDLVSETAHGTGNPHVWLDPIRVRDVLLPRLVERLAAVAPDSAAAIRARGEAFADSLTALDGEIRRMLDSAPTRRFVAAHPAWVYFAERYGLEQAGVVEPSPGAELGTRALAALVDRARELGVRAVIAEPQLGRAGVEALAGEVGARVATADAVGGRALEGREDYLSLMRYNARAFAGALGASEGVAPEAGGGGARGGGAHGDGAGGDRIVGS